MSNNNTEFAVDQPASNDPWMRAARFEDLRQPPSSWESRSSN